MSCSKTLQSFICISPVYISVLWSVNMLLLLYGVCLLYSIRPLATSGHLSQPGNCHRPSKHKKNALSIIIAVPMQCKWTDLNVYVYIYTNPCNKMLPLCCNHGVVLKCHPSHCCICYWGCKNWSYVHGRKLIFSTNTKWMCYHVYQHPWLMDDILLCRSSRWDLLYV